MKARPVSRDRVAELFPNDLALALHGIRGYYGARLESSDGVPLGVLVVMDNAPIRDRADIASLVSVFAARAAAELERLGAEAALRSTGERFASVFSTSPTPIAITVMAEGRFEDVNPAFEKTFGWSRNELLGRSAIDIGIWQSPAERERWVAELRTNHRTRDFETVHLTKTGEPLTILLSAETIKREGVLHIIAFARDETQRRRAEEAKRAALERFEAIFQHAPNVAIQGFDARGTIMHWNRASETLYGIPSDEAIGRPLQELLHTPDTVREFESVVADICASGMPSAPGEWPIPLRDGREIWVLSTMFPVFSEGMVAEIFCMDVDITDLKLANESVRRLNVELEARVAARTAELARLNKELEAFSYSVSHDLRAPLRSIEGFGRLLELDCADLLDATGRDYVSRMCRSAKRLAQLIDDLLDLTRIDRAEIRPGPAGTLAPWQARSSRNCARARRSAVSGLLSLPDCRRRAILSCCASPCRTCSRTRGSTPAGRPNPASSSAARIRPANASITCRTTAPASTWLTPTSCSCPSSACTARMNSKAPALGWLQCPASSSVITAASGPRLRRARAPHFSLPSVDPSRRRGAGSHRAPKSKPDHADSVRRSAPGPVDMHVAGAAGAFRMKALRCGTAAPPCACARSPH
ncbi:MAG: PAS domain S-box protein [Rhodocyclaceae bacterium]|nr:PAS domain S-box protein [Rhodocyclaceae bacterium]